MHDLTSCIHTKMPPLTYHAVCRALPHHVTVPCGPAAGHVSHLPDRVEKARPVPGPLAGHPRPVRLAAQEQGRGAPGRLLAGRSVTRSAAELAVCCGGESGSPVELTVCCGGESGSPVELTVCCSRKTGSPTEVTVSGTLKVKLEKLV